MSSPKFSPLSVLVVDDFSSFRSTLMGMLSRLGVKKLEEATRSQEVFKWCKEREFDIILCDYNLGSGRNGQHILEELRFKKLIRRQSLFVMVTAEASKEMVLSAYDCQPDDYLMKPLNLKVLEQRLGRLIHQRDILLPVYGLLDDKEQEAAIAQLEAIVSEPGRHVVSAQKLLGQLYLETGRLEQAEQLFSSNMDKRNLDWAQLGSAKVALANGQLNEAQDKLESLIAQSRLFLPAHDCLTEVLEQKGDFDAMLHSVRGAVELSPRSLFRQRKLAQVATEQGEVAQALTAAHEAMKLGEPSCHRSAADGLMFLSTVGNALAADIDTGHVDLLEETKKCLAKLSADHSVSDGERLQAQLLTARVHALSGDEQKAEQLAQQSLKQAGEQAQADIGAALAHYAYLASIEDLAAAHGLADAILAQHGADKLHGDQLDRLLPEPKNEHNRQRVARLNKAGIEHYNAGEHQQALIYFRQATLLFPRHVGLQLNYLQTLVGLVKHDAGNVQLSRKVEKQIASLKLLIPDDSHPQYARFHQLIGSTRLAAKGQ